MAQSVASAGSATPTAAAGYVPDWQITYSAGLQEVGTDNVLQAPTNRRSDLITEPSAGIAVTGDSARLQTTLNYAVTSQFYLNETDQNHVAQSLFGSERATIVPDYVFFAATESMSEANRSYTGVQNPDFQQKQNLLQTYTVSASPYAQIPFSRVGVAEFRYSASGTWFSGDNSPTIISGTPVGSVSDSYGQEGRFTFKMPGTIVPRLLSTIVGSDQYEDQPNGTGIIRRYVADQIDEYQLWRSFSLLAAGGYESISNRASPEATGSGAIWAGGARWRPNPDSSVMIVYGRYDLKTDFAGEARWLLSPRAAIYASYSDSITTSQGTISSNGGSASPQPSSANSGGAAAGADSGAAGISFDQSPLLAMLDQSYGAEETLLFGTPTSGDLTTPAGIPLSQANAFLPVQNGIFRLKSARANFVDQIENGVLTITAFHSVQIPLTNLVQAQTETDGATVTYSRPLAEDVRGTATGTFGSQTSLHTDTMDLQASLQYTFSLNINGFIRYDYIRDFVSAPNLPFTEDAVTIGIGAHF